MVKQKRSSYDAAFKRRVMKCAEESSNLSAANKFNVSEVNVRRWRKDKQKLLMCESKRRSFRGPKSGIFPNLEESLTKFVIDLREKCMPVTTTILQTKARDIARTTGVSLAVFRASRSWVQRYMKRAGFSLRRRTSVCQRLPADFERKLVNFQRYIIQKRQEKNYILGQIGNADQTPVYFDMPSECTITTKGAKQVKIISSGNEKSRITVMLCCTADGHKLPPYVILKRKTVPKKEAFPPGMIVRANVKGWMNAELVIDWLRQVWLKRPGSLLRLPSMLVLDAFRGHTTTQVKDALRDARSDLVVIPGGMTSQLQPLDVSVNKVFKAHLREKYNNWLISTEHLLTPTGKLKRPSCSLLCTWVAAAWKAVDTEIIRKAFIKCCISNNPDGSEDHLIGRGEDDEDTDGDPDDPEAIAGEQDTDSDTDRDYDHSDSEISEDDD